MASQIRSVDNTISADWLNPDNAFTENDLCTTAVVDLDINIYNIINTPFTIPVGATIDGIEVKTVRSTDDNDQYSIELQDKIPAWKLKMGTSYLAVCADATPETLGTPTDDWGGSWDAAHINSSSFQIRLQYHKIAKANTPSVDHIEVTVYYTEGGVTYEKTWQTDALFQKLGIEKTPIVDTALQRRGIEETADIDTIFALQTQKTLILDTLLKRMDIERTADVDTLLKRLDIQKTPAIDALFQKLGIEKTTSVDTLLKKLMVKTFTIDALFTAGETWHTTLHGTIDLTLIGCDERGFDWGTEPGNYTDDWTEPNSFGEGSYSHQITGLEFSEVYYFRSKAHNPAGWGYGGEKTAIYPTLKQFMIDVLFSGGQTYESTIQVDALFAKVGIGETADIDTVLKRLDIPLTAAVDALIKKLGITKTTNFDTLLKKLDIEKTISIDTIINLRIQKTAILDAFFKNTISKQTLIDAVFTSAIEKTFALDATFVRQGIELQRQMDTFFQRTVTVDFLLDSVFKQIGVQKVATLDVCLIHPWVTGVEMIVSITKREINFDIAKRGLEFSLAQRDLSMDLEARKLEFDIKKRKMEMEIEE